MHTYRCTNRRACGKRYKLAKPLTAYTRRPACVDPFWKCARCHKGELHATGHEIWRTNAHQHTCHCGLIPYPHREGSSTPEYVCAHSPDFDPFGPEG